MLMTARNKSEVVDLDEAGSSPCTAEGYHLLLQFGSDVYECVFFFQAEDGIRDLTVTGVQTCALPISVQFRAILGPFVGMEKGLSKQLRVRLAVGSPAEPRPRLRRVDGFEPVPQVVQTGDRKSVV